MPSKKKTEVPGQNEQLPHCLECDRFGQSCSGANMALCSPSLLRRILSLLMSRRRITHSGLSEASDVPKGTIDSFLSGKSADIRVGTSSRLLGALIGIPDPSCPFLDRSEDVLSLREQVDRLESDAARQLEQIERKDTLISGHMKIIRRQNRVITVLGVVLAVALIIIFTALVVDFFNHNIGFFWLGPSE